MILVSSIGSCISWHLKSPTDSEIIMIHSDICVSKSQKGFFSAFISQFCLIRIGLQSSATKYKSNADIFYMQIFLCI